MDSPNSSELELEFLDFLLIQGMKKELKPNSPNVSIEWIETGKNPEDLRDEPSVDLLFEERTTDFWRVISPYNGNIHHIVWLIIGCRIVFGIFVCLRFWIFCWLSFPVPFALYLQQFGTRTCHFAWYLLHFGMVTLHFAWYLLHVAMFAFHFAWYLSHFGVFNLSFAWYLLHFGTSNVHVGLLRVL